MARYEIDEVLSLRIQALTDGEKTEMAAVDHRTRQILERTQALAHDQMMSLHGAMLRASETVAHADTKTNKTIRVEGVEIRRGSRVRLQPSGRADAFDLFLNGMTATVQSIEEDFERNTYVTVTVDDDPGQDLGRQCKPGHRFFFRPHEITPFRNSESKR